jgi:hypothetical protein
LSLLPRLVVVDEVINSRISELDYFDFVGDGDNSDVSNDSNASDDRCGTLERKITKSKT